MRITRGRVLSQRFYDIADEIDLVRAEGLVRSLSRAPRSVRSAKQIRMLNPPLEMSLGSRPSPLPELPACEVLLRIYDVGAIAVTFVMEMPAGIDSEALIRLASSVTGPEEPFTQMGRGIADELAGAIRSACELKTTTSEVTEDYTVFRIYATEPKVDADALGDHLDMARLLLGETGQISLRERSQQSHAVISYSPEELVVIDWNAALIYDPSPANDLVDLLELTSMQLMELRAYDDIVGRSLERLYDELDKPRALFQSAQYGRLSRTIMRLFVDVSEMTDRIENSLHVLGDSWLARVHRAAITEFDIPRWQRLLDDKLNVLRSINEFLIDQITSRKALRLETGIVLLIVLEIILAIFKIT